jgi:hypothetical protein
MTNNAIVSGDRAGNQRARLRRPQRLMFLAALAILLLRIGAAQAAAYATLYNFQGSLDGGEPEGGVVIGKYGALYGTAYIGGTLGNGTVYELTPSETIPWKETVLYNFTASDGGNSASTMIFGSTGALYGTTTGGTMGTPDGTGAVFELAPPSTAGGAWTETVLYTLANQGNPNGTLALGPHGTLYATTQGEQDVEGIQYGAVEAVTPPAESGGAWTEHVIYSFDTPPFVAGTLPLAGVVFDGKVLFGTNIGNGYGGEVYALTPPATQGEPWTPTAIHNFGVSLATATNRSAPLPSVRTERCMARRSRAAPGCAPRLVLKLRVARSSS